MRYLKPREVQEVAARFGVALSTQHLANLRAARNSPIEFRKLAGRVYYRSDAVAAFLGLPPEKLADGRGCVFRRRWTVIPGEGGQGAERSDAG